MGRCQFRQQGWAPSAIPGANCLATASVSGYSVICVTAEGNQASVDTVCCGEEMGVQNISHVDIPELGKVQTVDVSEGRVAFADSLGRIALATIDTGTGALGDFAHCQVEHAAEAAWCGAKLGSRSADSHRLFATHTFSRAVCCFDISSLQATRVFNTTHPTSQILPSQENGGTGFGASVIVGESALLSVWDEREPSKGGCVQRIQADSSVQIGACYAIAAAPNMIAYGSGRSIRILDTRKWNLLTTHPDCVKHDIVWAGLFRNGVPVVAGFDRELVALKHGKPVADQDGELSKDRFRATGQWAGLSKVSDNQVLGVTDSGDLHCVDVETLF